ncbi:hypothetical protein Tco_0371333 [Tanacetum coccineum]
MRRIRPLWLQIQFTVEPGKRNILTLVAANTTLVVNVVQGISNFDSSQRIVVLHPIKLPPPPVLNLKDTEKIVVATDRKNKETLNNTEKFDHPSVSVDSGTSQMDPPLSKKLEEAQKVQLQTILKVIKPLILVSNLHLSSD